MNQGYQGFANYETWCVKLWLDNEESSYRYWQAAAQECWDEAEADQYFTREERARLDLEDRMKDEIEDAAGQAVEVGTIWADLLSSAVSEVNWREIAEAYLDSVERG